MSGIQLSLFEQSPEELVCDWILKDFEWEERYYSKPLDFTKWIRAKFRNQEGGTNAPEGFTWMQFKPGWLEMEDRKHEVVFRMREEKLVSILMGKREGK